ncbi:DUF2339 domain-containing protein [Acinetobacter sp. ANC 4216]|uniref:DUF2339 domain-containing protein n=1 Tax=Acinetobacter sp. ANC 4216 TaxID=2529840 RepID=UPI001038E52C|nr:DUF2339 domain-containing protein [Acinetobacter sp. ANC 4216]TCB63778.1 DUF2339 domain-containing protein [Acinetobacter sp. ANC 4216]
MGKGQSEIRMIWLMVLIIVGVGAWFLDVRIFTYLCGLAFVMSVMQYVDAIYSPAAQIAAETHLSVQESSKVPLYLCSIIAIVGGILDWEFAIAVGITGWVFFFLRWLRRLEGVLNQIQTRLQHPQTLASSVVENPQSQPHETQPTSSSELIEQFKQWIFQGNPVLKVAILVLVIGIILLLRFATEHWQLSLAVKLAIVAGISGAVTALGYWMQSKNRSFALALEGLGLAALFLTLFFAYYNAVIPTLAIAGLCFALIMGVTLILSLKQQSIELALMAMIIAYIAPFTLPVRNATAIELIAYYVVINLAVAVLSTLRPWKMLNQIAFLMTVIVGGGYAFYQGKEFEKNTLTFLVAVHTAIFVWLSFRFSQLIAKEDIAQFKLKPVLDIALIFGAPLVGYIFIYLMHFEETLWQAGASLAFAAVYAGLYQLSKRHQAVLLISQSYFSLMLIFLALIPPILLHKQWSVIGWAVEGLIIFIYALYRQSDISRYLAMGLMIVAGLSSLYYLVELNEFPNEMYWGLCLSYFAVVVVANSRGSFRQQLGSSTIAFHCLQMLSATTMLIVLLLDEIEHSSQLVMSLLIVSGFYLLINEAMLRCKATWTWLFPKWLGLIPVFVFALIIVIDQSQQGVIVWPTLFDRLGFALSGLMLTALWLRPLLGVRTEKEWVSFGTLTSLAMTSLTLLPGMPYISVVILPLLFCAWCYWQLDNPDWKMFWQARSSLVLMASWIICSQLFSQQAFQGYILPIINPFDLVSIAMLAGFIWMLSLQVKSGLDKGIVAVLMVLSLLWLSSYIVLRALHVYLNTPFNEMAVWGNATVQLSLTLLWVSLAFMTMSLASRKQLRSVWILGGSILVIVTLKLVLFDLSHIGTLTRVISFLGAGFVMLMIAYIAPIPEGENTNPSSRPSP